MSVSKKKQQMNEDKEKRDTDVKSTDSDTAAERKTQKEGDEKITDTGETKPEGDAKDLQELKAQLEELQSQVESLQAENSELKNQYLRKQADFENFRKRMQRDKADAIKYANSNLLQDLITIIDDFERAIRSSEESRDFDSFHSGIQMIERQFTSMLDRKYGLKRMESVGEEFDPQKHEAINMEESSDVKTQTVVEDYQKGYFLNERVLRHAKVKVAVPPAAGKTAGEEKKEEAAAESSAEQEASEETNNKE